MKRIFQWLLIAAVFIGIGVGVRHKFKQRAQERRDAAYALRLDSFTKVLTPGMTRKQVEEYLRANKFDFQQMCCVDFGKGTRAWDDLVRIGSEESPWFCSEKNVYVAFQFMARTRVDGRQMTDDSDTLRTVSIFRWLEGCL